MSPWYLPLRRADLNDATEYYVGTLERAAARLGRELRRVDGVDAIPARADVLVLDCKRACELLLRRPRARYWLWVQGILPEEVRLHLRSPVRQAYWTAFERLALPRARGVLLVSRAMGRHYASKYGLRALPSFVMPCVNQALDPAAFADGARYAAPSFVYAGSLHRWQCLAETLAAFALVRRARPAARLTVLTGQQDEARRAVAAAGLEGVEVGYVPLAGLSRALRAFKYGFVLRQPHLVNAVATPTKVSSYMGSGVVPVTTAAVHDYAERLGGLRHVVMTADADPARVAEAVLAFEERPIAPGEVLAEYRRCFEDYFDHQGYLAPLEAFLRRTGLETGAGGRP